MKVSNNLKQGSREWHAFRGTGLGASDAPVVMGVSPWTTRFELWAIKTKLMQPAEPHPLAAAAMRRGNDLEPKARELYIRQTGLHVDSDVNVEHPTHPFVRASLDGLSKDAKVIVEIKSPGKADLAEAAKGKIPKKYKWQLIQQMLLVPEAERLDYVTYDGDQTISIVQMKRNPQDEQLLLEELLRFWSLVQSGTPPEVDASDIDRVVRRMGTEFERLSQSMKALVLLNDILLRAQSAE